MKNKLLLLEDDISLVDGLHYSLIKNGFDLDVARTVKEAYGYLSSNSYDVLLLDITLPDGTGFDVCERTRKQGNNAPIIFLTALDEEVNIIKGLDIGGDDYITKPFKLGELCSRIRALLRRSGSLTATDVNLLSSDYIKIDLSTYKVTLREQVLELTNAEYRLLCLLIKNANKTLPRNTILDALWDVSGNYVDDNTLSVYIRRLREKIEIDPSNPINLLTIRGFGYQWREISK